MISIAVFQQSASQTSHQLKNRRKLTVVDINEHLRRHISSISIPKIRKLAYHPVLCGPCTHGFAIGNRSSGIKGFAPALTKNTRYSTFVKREGGFEKKWRQKNQKRTSVGYLFPDPLGTRKTDYGTKVRLWYCRVSKFVFLEKHPKDQ